MSIRTPRYMSSQPNSVLCATQFTRFVLCRIQGHALEGFRTTPSSSTIAVGVEGAPEYIINLSVHSSVGILARIVLETACVATT
jgi:hypothetical protein